MSGAVRCLRNNARALAGYAALGALVTLVAVPVSVAARPGDRPLVIRLAAGAILGVSLIHVRGVARRALDAQPPSAFERALDPGPPGSPAIDRQLRANLDDVRFGSASQQYWIRVVRPRLSALAARLPDSPLPEDPPRSRVRRLLGMGPSPAALRALVAKLEEQP